MRTPSFDFVGRSRLWAMISGGVVLFSLLSVFVGGLDLSIDFVGGSGFRLEQIRPDVTGDELRQAAEDAGASCRRSV